MKKISLLLAALCCLALVQCSSKSLPDISNRLTGPDWYKHVAFYHIWVRSFNDTNGDGIGDLKGVTAKLDYIVSLGIKAIWLSPFFPTPYFDSGYDISDYRAISPDYGTMADFDELLKEAHKRGLKVFADLVMNHTSIEHPWFLESRANKTNPKRDWYVWAATPNIPCNTAMPDIMGAEAWVYETTSGEHYFHQFYPQQPDLNYRNQEVVDEMLDTVKFWLDKGVDGFRVDAIMTLFEGTRDGGGSGEYLCMNHPLTHEFLKKVRVVLDGYSDKAMVAEAWAGAEQTAEYFGSGTNEFHMTFSLDYSAAMQATVLFGAASSVLASYKNVADLTPAGAHYGLWLSNHDQPRVMDSAGNNLQRAAAAAVMLMTLPGTPFLYYGDEVGMKHGTGVVVDSRDESRTPMQWTSGANCGFTTGTPWLAVAPGCDTNNVQAMEADSTSILALYRKLIALRNRVPIFGTGTVTSLQSDKGNVMVFARTDAGRGMLVVISFFGSEQTVEIDLAGINPGGLKLELSLSANPAFTAGSRGKYKLTLPAYGYVIWSY